jgi:hypothetical protein
VSSLGGGDGRGGHGGLPFKRRSGGADRAPPVASGDGERCALVVRLDVGDSSSSIRRDVGATGTGFINGDGELFRGARRARRMRERSGQDSAAESGLAGARENLDTRSGSKGFQGAQSQCSGVEFELPARRNPPSAAHSGNFGGARRRCTGSAPEGVPGKSSDTLRVSEISASHPRNRRKYRLICGNGKIWCPDGPKTPAGGVKSEKKFPRFPPDSRLTRSRCHFRGRDFRSKITPFTQVRGIPVSPVSPVTFRDTH